MDFEIVIKTLNGTARVLPVYSSDTALIDKINHHAEALKDILVSTIAGSHPGRPYDIEAERYVGCRKFLNYFLNQKHLMC